LTILLASASVWAARPRPLLGAELEFTNREIAKGNSRSPNTVNSAVAVRYKNRFKRLVMKQCQACEAERRKDGYGVPIWRIRFPDRWWFEITTDPYTLEIKTKPSTARQLARLQGRMQKYIFDDAHALGTFGRYDRDSAGHVHVGVTSSFGKDTLAFRNFLVDLANHPELAAGVLYKDFANAPPLVRLPERQVQHFRELIAAHSSRDRSIAELAAQIRERVHNRTVADWTPPEKYQAVSITRIDGEKYAAGQQTTELRSLPAHENADSFVHLAELLDARIAYLAKQWGQRPIRFYERRVRRLAPQDQVDRFFTYVAQSGLRWRDYAPLVDYRFRALPPSLTAARKVYGVSSPKMVQHVLDLIALRTYYRGAIVRWLHATPLDRASAVRVERALARAEAPLRKFDSPYQVDREPEKAVSVRHSVAKKTRARTP
jgi:hypothetical protein